MNKLPFPLLWLLGIFNSPEEEDDQEEEYIAEDEGDFDPNEGYDE
jgi:hypothetical protein